MELRFIKRKLPLILRLLENSYYLLKKVIKKLQFYSNRFVNPTHLQTHVKLLDFKSYAQLRGAPFHILDAERSLFINKPFIISAQNNTPQFQEGEALLPEVYMAELKNATIIEGSDLVIIKKKFGLYDELAQDPTGRYGLRIGLAPLVKKRYLKTQQVLLSYKKSRQKLPKYAIHFCKDYSYNYFHWLIEALPRLWIIEQFSGLAQLPLLVDSHLYPQQIEALKLLTDQQRELVQLQPNEAYRIKHLYYPSSLSVMHNNYDHPISFNKDALISPLAIAYLRSKFLPLIKGKENTTATKIYLSRGKLANDQRLANTTEIEAFLTKEGFIVFHPECLSFLEQVILFANASVIIGAGGSALANMVFVTEHCKIFLLSNNNHYNPYLFNMISNCVNCKLFHLVGKENPTEIDRGSHNQFTIDIAQLRSSLEKYL